MYEEARKGREWLEFLSPEPETPAGLLDRILAQTGPGQSAGFGLVSSTGNVLQMPPVMIPAWQRPGFVGSIRRYAEPRLLMTAAMAFFSIALTLNLTGFRLSSVRLSDLRPSMMRSMMERRVMTASTPVVRYYDHRIRYELESRLRDLRKLTESNEEDNQLKPKDGTPVAPGESRQAPTRREGEPTQQSVSPAHNDSDVLESYLGVQQRFAHSGDAAQQMRERSTVWTA
jgi:hypothetical protein